MFLRGYVCHVETSRVVRSSTDDVVRYMAAFISFSDLSVPELIELGQRATDVALANSAVIESLTPPYDRKTLLGARKKLFELTDAFLRQSSKGARLTKNAAEVDLAREAFHVASYMPHLSVAHQVFCDQEEILNRFDAVAQASDVFRIWAMRVRQFYLSVLTDPRLTSAMAEKNISVAELTVALSEFQHIVAMDRERNPHSTTGSVADFEKRVADLQTWLGTFFEVATTRLDDASELIEGLGIARGRA